MAECSRKSPNIQYVLVGEIMNGG